MRATIGLVLLVGAVGLSHALVTSYLARCDRSDHPDGKRWFGPEGVFLSACEQMDDHRSAFPTHQPYVDEVGESSGRQTCPPRPYVDLRPYPRIPRVYLSTMDILDGMFAVKPAVAACFARYKPAGVASVSITIEADGHVSSASVLRSLAGTEAGTCIEAAVKAARFPASLGKQTIVYPFMQR
jgi:hypothetical protein